MNTIRIKILSPPTKGNIQIRIYLKKKLYKEQKVAKNCQYHGTYGFSTHECTTIKTLVKQANPKKFKQNKER